MEKKISYRRGESISLFFLFPFLPLLREYSERTTELGSVGEHPRKYLFHVIFLFCFKFTKVRNCLFTKNSYQENIPSSLRMWELKGERKVRGGGELGLDLMMNLLLETLLSMQVTHFLLAWVPAFPC